MQAGRTGSSGHWSKKGVSHESRRSKIHHGFGWYNHLSDQVRDRHGPRPFAATPCAECTEISSVGQDDETTPASHSPPGRIRQHPFAIAFAKVFYLQARPPPHPIRGIRADAQVQPVKEGMNMIRKLKSGQYRIYSRKMDPKTGKRRNLGTFPTRAAAEKHEREIQFFKHKSRL